jgi:ribosomal protein L37AE/L43A
VPRPDFPRSILEFQRRFGDEDACRRYLFASRWPDGFSCPRCGGARAGEQPKRRLWECRACGHQTSVTAGTVMHATRTPLRVWFWAAYLVATHHPGISAVRTGRRTRRARARHSVPGVSTSDHSNVPPGTALPPATGSVRGSTEHQHS